MNSVAMATLGTVQRTKKDWLTCETLDLIEQKRAARLAGNTVEYKRLTSYSQLQRQSPAGQAAVG